MKFERKPQMSIQELIDSPSISKQLDLLIMKTEFGANELMTMPRKNREEYNEYMRNYHKRKAQEKKLEAMELTQSGATNMKNDDDFTQSAEFKQAVQTVRNATKDEDGEDDVIIKYMDRFAKYAPIVQKVLEGFMTNLKAAQPAMQQAYVMPKPAGYDAFAAKQPVEQYAVQYSNPSAYAQYMQYQDYLSGVPNQPTVPTHMPQMTPTHMQEMTPREQKIAAAFGPDAVQSEREIAQGVASAPPKPAATPPSASEKPAFVQEAIQNQQEEAVEKSEPVEEIKKPSEVEQMQKVLEEDVQKQLMSALSYLKDMSNEQFTKQLENTKALEAMIGTYRQFMMPIQIKQALDQSSVDELFELLTQECPEKIKIVEEKSKINQLRELLAKLKGV